MEASEFHSQESPVRDSTETFVPADGVFCSAWNCRKCRDGKTDGRGTY